MCEYRRSDGISVPVRAAAPLLFLACVAMTGLLYNRFGLGLQLICGSLFAWSLILLAAIDLHRQILPDRITLPLVWAGLLVNLDSAFATLEHAVVGAVAGYLSLWLVNRCNRLRTGREGIGHGDFKMLAAIGAWLGWQPLPYVVLAASLIHVLFGLFLIRARDLPQETPFPFGPSLAFGGCFTIGLGVPAFLL